MTIDPAIIIAFITAILALLGLFLRAFASGDLLSKNVVPRDDYEALRAINASYPEAMNKIAEAVRTLAASVDVMRRNGK